MFARLGAAAERRTLPAERGAHPAGILVGSLDEPELLDLQRRHHS